jgi:ribonuclease G
VTAAREILINAAPEETRVLVLEGGRVAEVLIERSADRSLVGSVFVGRVDRVLPGMQSAFVDIGLPRHAFLYVSDVLPDEDGIVEPPIEPSPDVVSAAEAEPDAAEPTTASTPGTAPAQASPSTWPSRRGSERRIEDLVERGERLVVQVTREPIGTKGARVTTQVTFPGKLLVYLPLSDHLGISKRIEDEALREEVKAKAQRLREGVEGGFIVRTAGASEPYEALGAERDELVARWRQMQARVEAAQPPARIHEELPLALRVLRDLLDAEVTRIVVDDDAVHREVREFVQRNAPALLPVVHHYRGPTGLFDAFSLEQEIEKAVRGRVWLRSGGYLVIDQLEALVAVDVNTGKFTGNRRLEDTALQTNLEAAREVARQLRLRDLGGIIVVDFIDLLEPGHRKAVLDELKAALVADRAKTTVLGMSDFGLVELTRQRQKRSLAALLTEPCPYCGGAGRIKSVETTVNQILRRVRSHVGATGEVRVKVRLHPDVAHHLRSHLVAFERAGTPFPARIELLEDVQRHRETFDVGG